MSFNPNRNKLKKKKKKKKDRKCFNPSLWFKYQSIERSVTHKHLGLSLDKNLSFTNCINYKINKTMKVVGLLL